MNVNGTLQPFDNVDDNVRTKHKTQRYTLQTTPFSENTTYFYRHTKTHYYFYRIDMQCIRKNDK